MQYFKNLIESFFKPELYQAFIKAKSRKAFGHFALSMVLIGVVQGFYFGSVLLPEFREKAQQSLDQLMTVYPAELQITWDGEQLTTTPAEFDELRFDSGELAIFDQVPGGVSPNQAALYVNRDLSLSEAVDLMAEEDVEGVIDQRSAFFVTEGAGVEELLLRDYLQDTTFVIDRDSLPLARDYLGQGLEAVLRMALWFLPIIFALALLVSRLIVSLIFATLLLFPARLGKAISNWRESWRFTLVLLVVVETLSQATRLLYPQLSFPVYSVAFWSLSLFILLALNTEKTPPRGKKRTRR